jgi:ATP/maltotriose-dependent transcriptional regulator MalT
VACLELDRKDHPAARVDFDQALAQLPQVAVVPWLSIYLQIVLGRAALELDDLAAAGSLLAAARRGLVRHPDAGELPRMLASAERAQEAAQGGGRTLLEPLTQAELRVLELAPTCLSIEEVGRTLCLSKNTVKTHLKAIYAKLSVASRSEAVERARTLRLIV